MNAIILPKLHPSDNQSIGDTREAHWPLARMTASLPGNR